MELKDGKLMKLEPGTLIYIEKTNRYHYFAYNDGKTILGAVWEPGDELEDSSSRDWDISVWEFWQQHRHADAFEMIQLSKKAKEIKTIRKNLLRKLFTGWLNI